MNRNRSVMTVLALCAALLAGCTGKPASVPFPELTEAEEGAEVRIGQGVVRTSLDGTGYQPPQPHVYKTDRVTGPIPTNDWWSSLAWGPFSGAMYPHPLVIRVGPDGLNVAYPPVRTSSGGFHALYKHSERDLTVGGRGHDVDDGLLNGFGDWHVDMLLPNKEGTAAIRATSAHGSPYLYFTFEGTDPFVTLNGEATFEETGHAHEAVFTVNGHAYALFAPAGTSWIRDAGGLTVELPEDARYVSLALLPDTRPETVETFRRYAYSFITDTIVSWRYDEETSRVETTYRFVTKPMEGKEKGTLTALYPHQWKHVTVQADDFLPYGYESPRGVMKVLAGESFRTVMTYPGILPFLPAAGADEARLREYLADERVQVLPSPEAEGTYWYGKNYNRLAQLIPIARQLGESETEEQLRQTIREDMERALTGADPARIAYYDRIWGTLNLYPTQFGADLVLNDHHFHYGYWVLAAAMLAYEDAEWARSDRMGGMIELLIRDYANWERGEDQPFPFLRTFDPYAGHSWASGNATDINSYSPGNNQESSSEALMAAAALILWGDATGNRAIRDTGIYLYTTEVEAVKNYWLDTENEHFPEAYEQDYAPIVVSAGGEFRTWWTTNPEEIYGINVLPVTGASLYWGHDPDYARKFYDDMAALNGGPPQEWRDILGMLRALYDPSGALADFEASPPVPEYGESRTHTYHWIANLNALGRVDPSIVADTPLFAVFRRDDRVTYAAYNGGDKPITVTFKRAADGAKVHTMKVPAKEMAAETVSGG